MNESFSEIGALREIRRPVRGVKMPYAILQVRFLQTEVFPRLLHGVLLAFLREQAAVLRNLPFLAAHERVWPRASLMPLLPSPLAPKMSHSISGNRQSYI